MTHFDSSFGCSSWFIRSLTWVAITVAFVLSIVALDACDLVEGVALQYLIPDEDEAVANATTMPRAEPSVTDTYTFSLGVYKAELALNRYYRKCLPYGNGVSDAYLNAGSAEGSARFFGTLAAALGGLSMLAFFGLAATEPTTKTRLYITIFTCILGAAAFSQMLIFTLMASEHCDDGYWNDFLSAEVQEGTTSAVTCEIGDGGWNAIFALILYIFAALLVALKWLTPSFSLCTLEYTKDFSDARLASDEEDQLQAPTVASTQKEILPLMVEQEEETEVSKVLAPPEAAAEQAAVGMKQERSNSPTLIRESDDLSPIIHGDPPSHQMVDM